MATITKIEQNIPTIKPRKKVAAYARVSMESERLSHSLSAQISYYSDLIQKNPEWEYAGVYADSFVTGTSTKHRDEFQRMVKDCEECKVDIVLCKSISRMARNTVDLLKTVRHLKDIGVEVRFEKENISTITGDGELMLSILASYAQEESRSISDNIKWSKRKEFQKGKVPAIRIYGYKFDNGQYAILPNEAEIVKRIFDLYLNGWSCGGIAKALNDEGIKSCRGKAFSGMGISEILRNEKYTGNALLQKYFCDGPKNERKNNGELPMYYVEGTHPAIISKETFDAVQEEKAKRYGLKIKNGIAENASFCNAHREGLSGEAMRYMWTDEEKKHWSDMQKKFALKHRKFDLSSFIKCERCGEFLSMQKNYQSNPQYMYWNCGHHCHNKDKVVNDVPKAKNLRDDILKSIISEVIGMEKFDADIMRDKLSGISVSDYVLTFHFTDGHTEKIQYKKERKPWKKQ